MTTRRARDTAAKLSRRRQLLEAAAACLDAAGYAATTMSEIAIAAGLAKGTTYLYFRSKEELFLELLLEELEDWAAAAETGLDEAEAASRAEKKEAAEKEAATEREAAAEREEKEGKEEEPEKPAMAESERLRETAALMAATLARRRRLVRLLALRVPLLEPGTRVEAAQRFRSRQLARLEPLAARLEATLPGIDPEGALAALVRFLALAAGLADRAEPFVEDTEGDVLVAQVSRSRPSFAQELSSSMELFLLAAREPAATPPAP